MIYINIVKYKKLKGEINMFKKKVLTPSMMIQKAVGVVENAVSMFNLAVSEIDKANEILKESKYQSQTKIESLEQELLNTKQIKEDAESKINAHLELREKLSQFTQ